LRRLGVPCVVVLLAMVLAVPALAHAALVSASPGPGEVVAEPLTKIVLRFDDVITPQSQIALVAADFQLTASWSQSVEGSTLTAEFGDSLPPGTYTLVWTAVTQDKHTTTGSYQFAVSPAGGGDIDWPAILLLAIGFLALVAGVIVWRHRTSAA